jgi:amino acid transporter
VSAYFLATLFVVVWVVSWWGPRRFRVGFALSSPVVSVAAIILAFWSVPRGSCDHGCVVGWAANLDSSEGLANALMTFPVAIAIATITGIVEIVRFVRRNWSAAPEGPPQPDKAWASESPPPPPDTAPVSESPPPPPPDAEPAWSDLMRGPRRH